MSTLDYYNTHAAEFVSATVNVEFHTIQDRFLQYLASGVHILDFGCGSGRDAKYFLEKGFRVTATDGSGEICKMASEYAGIPVQQMLFQELDAKDEYEGIWACSSILHLPKKELKLVLGKMFSALKVDGVIYTSFKQGDYEGVRNGRHFTDFTLEEFRQFISDFTNMKIEEYWITGDVRPGREEEKWLNLILRKVDIN